MNDKVAHIRSELSLTDDILAVNAASWGPLCKAASDRMAQEIRADEQGRRYSPNLMMETVINAAAENQAAVSKFLGCDSAEVVPCESTTYGLNACLWGAELSEGDEIVSGNLENGAGLAALINFQFRKNIKVIYADQSDPDTDSVEAVLSCITPKTKLILLSDVNYVNSRRADLTTICRKAGELGILTVIDGVQAFITTPTDVKKIGCDAYAIALHKFACGPDGAGALYVNKASLVHFNATFAGVFSIDHHGVGSQLEDAGRFKLSTWAYYPHLGGAKALEWIRSAIGIDCAGSRIQLLRGALWDQLSVIPRIILHSAREGCGGTILLEKQGVDTDLLSQKLIDKKVYNRVVAHSYPPDYDKSIKGVRLSTGFWTRDEDVMAIAAIISEL